MRLIDCVGSAEQLGGDVLCQLLYRQEIRW